MDDALRAKLDDAVWVCRSLFERGKTGGSTGNISFRHGDLMYVSAGGGCFGRIAAEDFAVLRLLPDGGTELTEGSRKPSKEYPMHAAFYAEYPDVGAVVHTHGPYAELFSCLPPADPDDAVPKYTPYLEMKLGKVAWIPYAAPGSEELFAHVRAGIGKSRGFLLANHGAVVGGKSLFDAFYAIEELEDSCRIAWELRNVHEAARIG